MMKLEGLLIGVEDAPAESDAPERKSKVEINSAKK